MKIAFENVTCQECAKTYQCTPADDYHHKPDLPHDERTTENGYCNTCLLESAGIDPKNLVDFTKQEE